MFTYDGVAVAALPLRDFVVNLLVSAGGSVVVLRWDEMGFLNRIRKAATNKYVLLTAAVVVLLTGLVEVWEVPSELKVESRSVGGYGLIVLALFISLRASVGFFKSVDLIHEALESDGETKEPVHNIFNRITASPYFEGTTALLLLVTGGMETIEVWGLEETQIWHFGILLLGISMLGRAASEIIESAMFADKVGLQLGTSIFHKISRFLRSDRLELSIGLILVFLGAAEVWIEWRTEEGQFQLGGHHGMLLMGLLDTGRYFPDFLQGLEFVSDVEEEKLEKTDKR